MPLAFYFDVNVPVSIAKGLQQRGIDVLTSVDDGTRHLEDSELLQRATLLGRVLATHDKDFLAIAAEYQAAGWEFTGIVFAPQDKLRIGHFVDDIELIAHCCAITEVANRVIHLPLS
jgi:hypothetical protein